MIRSLSLLVATACYLGFIPGIPGTYASIATTVVYYLIDRGQSGISVEIHLALVFIIFVIGVLSSTKVARDRGSEDPRFVVIDEVAGQLLTFWMIPTSLLNLAVGMILFRIFDIWKPYPIRRLEHFRYGLGIMADDILAGVYANLTLHLFTWLLRTVSRSVVFDF